MKFDIYNPETWENVPDENVVIDGVELFNSETLQPMKWVNLITFVNSLINFSEAVLKKHLTLEEKKQIIKNKIELLKKIGTLEAIETAKKAEQISKNYINDQLNDTSLLLNSKFNAYDKNTWKYAKEDKILVVNDRICSTSGEISPYLTEPKFIKDYQAYLDYTKEKKDTLKHYIERLLRYEKIVNFYTSVDNVGFTKAMYDLAGDKTEKTLKQLADAIVYSEENNLKKYQFQQYLFENHINVSSYDFTDLYFAEKNHYISDIPEIISDYYAGFEEIEDINELNALLNSSLYLSDFPELKNEIRERLIDNLEL